MTILELFQFHILLILFYKAMNYIALNLECYIEPFYIDILLKQNKFMKQFIMLLHFLVRNPKYYFSLHQE